MINKTQKLSNFKTKFNNINKLIINKTQKLKDINKSAKKI